MRAPAAGNTVASMQAIPATAIAAENFASLHLHNPAPIASTVPPHEDEIKEFEAKFAAAAEEHAATETEEVVEPVSDTSSLEARIVALEERMSVFNTRAPYKI